MSAASLASRSAATPEESARLHFVLRFAAGTTAAFVICEALGWYPAGLAAVLTALLLANLPFSPPLKLGVALVAIMWVCATSAYSLTVLMKEAPFILFGVVGTAMFIAFAGLSQGKAQLPLTLLLVCMAVLPVITLTQPAIGLQLCDALVRAMAVAVIMTWIAHAIWPRVTPPSPPPPQQPIDSAVAAAALGAAIVLPVMLIYMLFGIIDAIPVLLTTVLVVAKMEEEKGAADAFGKMIGNFLGGVIAIIAYYLLYIAPNLLTLALILFIVAAGIGMRIAKGGPAANTALLIFNAMIVIFDLGILKGSESSGTWGSRLVQFSLAGFFAVGMMTLLWPKLKAGRNLDPPFAGKAR